MDEQLRIVRREVARLRRMMAAMAMALALILLAAAAFRPSQDEIITARGIVITDSLGRDRILIGAPIPSVEGRVRTDPERVREHWAGRYPDPDQYMGYYANYRHDTNGMLVLDGNGFDRLVVGDPVPDPNIGRRIAPSTGLVVNDRKGFERTGYGVLDLGERYRVVLGLDGEQGEGVVLYLDDAGRRGMAVIDGEHSARLGANVGDEAEECLGLRLLDGQAVVREVALPECD